MRHVALAVVAATLCLAQNSAFKPGVERWPIKTMGPEGTAKARQVALADLLAFEDAAEVTRNEKLYQDKRIPVKVHGDFQEGQLITTTGYLHLVAGEDDGDYHIQISATAESGDHCLIVEVPFGDEKFVKVEALRPQFEAVRTFLKEKTLAGKNPSAGGSVMRRPPYVSVTGVLFYDDSHVGDQPRGKKGMKAATLWELHPVTAMTFAPLPK